MPASQLHCGSRVSCRTGALATSAPGAPAEQDLLGAAWRREAAAGPVRSAAPTFRQPNTTLLCLKHDASPLDTSGPAAAMGGVWKPPVKHFPYNTPDLAPERERKRHPVNQLDFCKHHRVAVAVSSNRDQAPGSRAGCAQRGPGPQGQARAATATPYPSLCPPRGPEDDTWQHRGLGFWTLSPCRTEPGLLGETTDSGTGTEKGQNGPRTDCCATNLGVNDKRTQKPA